MFVPGWFEVSFLGLYRFYRGLKDSLNRFLMFLFVFLGSFFAE